MWESVRQRAAQLQTRRHGGVKRRSGCWTTTGLKRIHCMPGSELGQWWHDEDGSGQEKAGTTGLALGNVAVRHQPHPTRTIPELHSCRCREVQSRGPWAATTLGAMLPMTPRLRCNRKAFTGRKAFIRLMSRGPGLPEAGRWRCRTGAALVEVPARCLLVAVSLVPTADANQEMEPQAATSNISVLPSHLMVTCSFLDSCRIHPSTRLLWAWRCQIAPAPVSRDGHNSLTSGVQHPKAPQGKTWQDPFDLHVPTRDPTQNANL